MTDPSVPARLLVEAERSARLLEFAWKWAVGEHHACRRYIDHNGHDTRMSESCPHPDCVLVRAAVPSPPVETKDAIRRYRMHLVLSDEGAWRIEAIEIPGGEWVRATDHDAAPLLERAVTRTPLDRPKLARWTCVTLSFLLNLVFNLVLYYLWWE